MPIPLKILEYFRGYQQKHNQKDLKIPDLHSAKEKPFCRKIMIFIENKGFLRF